MSELTAQAIFDIEKTMINNGVKPPFIVMVGSLAIAKALILSTGSAETPSPRRRTIKVGLASKKCWHVGKIGNTEIYAES